MFGKTKTQMEAWTVPLKPETVDLEAMAIAASPAAKAQFRGLLALFRAAHRKDVASYTFECQRFGDFLSVFIRRGKEEHASAINMGRSRNIEFRAGGVPDTGGEVLFYSYIDGSTPDPATGKSYSNSVAPNMPINWTRTIIRVEPEPVYYPPQPNGGGNYYGGYQNVQNVWHSQGANGGSGIQHKLTNAPRPAKDDKIEFQGARTTLYIPAGLGRGVYDAILAEVGSRPAKRRGRVAP